MALPRLLCVWLLVAGTRGVRDGDMRLADGDAPNEGRVEIFYGGRWGTVCDNLWDLADAGVVCRALGFENATQALGRAAFGPGSGPVMLDEVQCTGTEASLADCSSLGWLRSKCRHSQDAGVVCSNETEGARTLDLSGELPAALARLFDSQRGCDLAVAVKAEGAAPLSLCAHSLVLSANPEARALWAEPGSSVTMEVDAECLPVVTDFLRYFYSRRITVSLSTVKCLHQLASTFGAGQLQAHCAGLFAYLLPQDPSFRTALELHAYALATRDAALEGLCVRFLAWNFEALTGSEEAWPAVPPGLLRTLLSRSELAVPSELALLTALDAWSRAQGAAPPEEKEVEGLLREVRFPMIPPEDLFQLPGSLGLYAGHRALLQERTLQALEFHTVPLPLLAQLRAGNLSQDAYRPRLYTSPAWSGAVDGRASASSSNYGPYDYGYGKRPYGRRYSPTSAPSGSFQTPAHPSFLFRNSRVSWTLVYLPTVQSCWNYGFSCSSDEVPLLRLSRSGSSDPTVGYENKALMVCGGRFVADVVSFEDGKAPVPSALETSNSSRRASAFPCPAGSFSSFRAVIRPFYLTNSSGVD